MTTTESTTKVRTSSKHAHASRHRRQEGAAYMESIIVLPALILVFGLILFVREGYTKAAKAGSETRGAGWTNVMASCTTDDVAAPTTKEDLGSGGFSGAAAALTVLLRDARTLMSNQPNVVLSGPALTLASFKINRRNYTQSATVNRARSIGGTARYGHRIALTCDEDIDYLEMPGLVPSSFGTWSFFLWNEGAWLKADL